MDSGLASIGENGSSSIWLKESPWGCSTSFSFSSSPTGGILICKGGLASLVLVLGSLWLTGIWAVNSLYSLFISVYASFHGSKPFFDCSSPLFFNTVSKNLAANFYSGVNFLLGVMHIQLPIVVFVRSKK